MIKADSNGSTFHLNGLYHTVQSSKEPCQQQFYSCLRVLLTEHLTTPEKYTQQVTEMNGQAWISFPSQGRRNTQNLQIALKLLCLLMILYIVYEFLKLISF